MLEGLDGHFWLARRLRGDTYKSILENLPKDQLLVERKWDAVIVVLNTEEMTMPFSTRSRQPISVPSKVDEILDIHETLLKTTETSTTVCVGDIGDTKLHLELNKTLPVAIQKRGLQTTFLSGYLPPNKKGLLTDWAEDHNGLYRRFLTNNGCAELANRILLHVRRNFLSAREQVQPSSTNTPCADLQAQLREYKQLVGKRKEPETPGLDCPVTDEEGRRWSALETAAKDTKDCKIWGDGVLNLMHACKKHKTVAPQSANVQTRRCNQVLNRAIEKNDRLDPKVQATCRAVVNDWQTRYNQHFPEIPEIPHGTLNNPAAPSAAQSGSMPRMLGLLP